MKKNLRVQLKLINVGYYKEKKEKMKDKSSNVLITVGLRVKKDNLLSWIAKSPKVFIIKTER